jgi:hypothetical protein
MPLLEQSASKSQLPASERNASQPLSGEIDQGSKKAFGKEPVSHANRIKLLFATVKA